MADAKTHQLEKTSLDPQQWDVMSEEIEQDFYHVSMT